MIETREHSRSCLLKLLFTNPTPSLCRRRRHRRRRRPRRCSTLRSIPRACAAPSPPPPRRPSQAEQARAQRVDARVGQRALQLVHQLRARPLLPFGRRRVAAAAAARRPLVACRPPRPPAPALAPAPPPPRRTKVLLPVLLASDLGAAAAWSSSSLSCALPGSSATAFTYAFRASSCFLSPLSAAPRRVWPFTQSARSPTTSFASSSASLNRFSDA